MRAIIDRALYQNIVEYYEETDADYGFWSRNHHMHYGIGGLFNVFSRERMLDRMSDEVIRRMNLCSSSSLIADFGCGAGSTMRRAAVQFPKIRTVGITLVPGQKTRCDTLSKDFDGRISVRLEDYHSTSLQPQSCDAVYCIESACYSPPHLHAALFEEAYRVLKTAGRLVVADGFFKTSPAMLSATVRKQYTGICKNWCLPGMMEIQKTQQNLEAAGFSRIHVEEMSWRVACSVLHVPFVILWFLFRKKLNGEKLSARRIQNLRGSFQTLLLGLQQKHFGYYIITGEK